MYTGYAIQIYFALPRYVVFSDLSVLLLVSARVKNVAYKQSRMNIIFFRIQIYDEVHRNKLLSIYSMK